MNAIDYQKVIKKNFTPLGKVGIFFGDKITTPFSPVTCIVYTVYYYVRCEKTHILNILTGKLTTATVLSIGCFT